VAASPAARVLAQCHELATISQDAGRLTRPFATPAMARANVLVGRWMREAGLDVRLDEAGTLVGRLAGEDPSAGTLLLGSHLDTVRDAGAFDGPLGVLSAIACVRELRDAGIRLPAALEVIGFCDEEGLRFGTAYLGSRALAGEFDPALVDLVDDDGVTLGEALRAFGGDPRAIGAASRRGERILGYCEVHMEQGPLLEQRDLPVAVVSAIAGATRAEVHFTGRAGHAGTVPMDLRRDALCAAAEWVTAVESASAQSPGLLATVGRLTVAPGAANVVPGSAFATLDVRHAEDELRDEAVALLLLAAEAAGERRSVGVDWRVRLENPAVAMEPRLSACLTEAMAGLGLAPAELTSGAGHDAVALASLTAVAMLFVRCAGGVSHHPAESVAEEDIGVALGVLGAFVRRVCA
jgi:allantoate deiminase